MLAQRHFCYQTDFSHCLFYLADTINEKQTNYLCTPPYKSIRQAALKVGTTT